MGPYLSQPIRQKATIQGQGKEFTFCVSQMQGWRKTMEDAAIHKVDLGDGNSLFAVFDGHGGPQVSKFVQKQFIKILTELHYYKTKKYKEALIEAFMKMDEHISSQKTTIELNAQRNVHISDPISKNTGCTANVLLITPTQFIVANAGDSRSVLCRQGKAIDLSIDHKPQSQQQERRIKHAGGVVYMGRVNGGLNLTRSFGDFEYKKNDKLKYDQQMITCHPDVKIFQRIADKDEFILLGCDGICQGLIDLVKRYIVDNKENNKKILETLLDELLAKDSTGGIGCDNMTSILIRFK